MKISSHISSDNNKLTEKRVKDPLSGYLFILTETLSEEDGEYSLSAYSLHGGLTYIGTPEPIES